MIILRADADKVLEDLKNDLLRMDLPDMAKKLHNTGYG